MHLQVIASLPLVKKPQIHYLHNVFIRKMNHRRGGHHSGESSTTTETTKGYEIRKFLGQGQHASVFRAWSKKKGQEVAMKRIDKKYMKTAGMVERVKKEIEIHSRLKHPSISEVYDYFEDSNFVYLVLELCHYGDFRRYLQSQGGVLTEAETRKVMWQVVNGMLYLQSHGILHRDLTLSNLLLTHDMKIKIADFGLATQLTKPGEKQNTMCGTPNFMSPEVAMGRPHGLEADVWSLGCILYAMLVGQLPFDSDSVSSTLNRVIQGKYDLPSNLSPEASDLIKGLLRMKPGERLQLKGVLSHPFMTKNSMATRNIAQMSGVSIDSGHGTLATLGSSRSGSSGRGQLTAFPLTDMQSHISENEEAPQVSSRCGGDSNQWSGRGYHLMNQQSSSSPPTAGSERMPDFILRENKCGVLRRTAAPSTNSGKSNALEHTTGAIQFDPNRYQESGDTPSSSSWSFRASSVNSATPAGGCNPQDPNHQMRVNCGVGSEKHPLLPYAGHESGFSSQEEFYLQSTKKTLDFDGCSLQHGSLHNRWAGADEAMPMQTASAELLTKVQAYLGQCQHDASRSVEKRQGSGSLGFPKPVEFGTPERVNKVKLTEQEMNQCIQTGSMENLSSPRSSSDGEKRVDEKQGGKTSTSDGQSDTVDRPREPLNTQRLRPIRQKTKNAVVNIMDNGDVCLEFVKNKGKEQRVVEVFSISSDGLQVTVFHPGEGGRGVPVSDSPPLISSAAKTFTLHKLPDKYFKKYQYAARFVGLVRSKTPKVTMYTEKAKCMLMENSKPPDFEAAFYEGSKVSVSQRGIRILEKTGTSVLLDSVKSRLHLSQDTQELVDYVEKCRQQCMQLEAVITAVQSNGLLKEQLFPVIVGRRPSIQADNNKQSLGSGEIFSASDNCPTKVIAVESATMPSLPSFNDTLASTMTDTDAHKLLHGNSVLDNTLLSTVTATSTSSENSTTLITASHDVFCHHVFVADIGWASQLANGEIWMKFNDGTQLGMKSIHTTITYIDISGRVSKYQKNQMTPKEVIVKVEQLRQVVENLRAKSSAASCVAAR